MGCRVHNPLTPGDACVGVSGRDEHEADLVYAWTWRKRTRVDHATATMSRRLAVRRHISQTMGGPGAFGDAARFARRRGRGGQH